MTSLAITVNQQEISDSCHSHSSHTESPEGHEHHCDGHAHLHYNEAEMKQCGCGEVSVTSEVDCDDFWNMTLDDLDLLVPAPPAKPSRRSSTSDMPERTTSATAVTASARLQMPRRGSDGMLLGASNSFHSALRKKERRTPSRKANVSFGSVKIRVCERVLGDNPSCKDGPSLSIGWKYEDANKDVNVEEFENKRVKERRSSAKLCLTPEKREKIAKRNGYTKKDIEDNMKNVAKCQRRRERTLKELETLSMQDTLASVMMSSSKKASLAKFLKTQNGGGSSSSKSGRRLSSISV